MSETNVSTPEGPTAPGKMADPVEWWTIRYPDGSLAKSNEAWWSATPHRHVAEARAEMERAEAVVFGVSPSLLSSERAAREAAEARAGRAEAERDAITALMIGVRERGGMVAVAEMQQSPSGFMCCIAEERPSRLAAVNFVRKQAGLAPLLEADHA